MRILSCKMLWCWIGLSDAWAAVFLWDQTAWIKPFLQQHEQRRASATSHCNLNWSLGKHHIVAHRLDNQWEIAVICFAPATIVLMREFRTRKRETSELLSAHPHTVRSVFCLSFFFIIEREREQPRVPAVHTTYITVLLYERYYRLKNAMAPWVFLSFSISDTIVVPVYSAYI